VVLVVLKNEWCGGKEQGCLPSRVITVSMCPKFSYTYIKLWYWILSSGSRSSLRSIACDLHPAERREDPSCLDSIFRGCMDVCVWILVNLNRFTHLSVTKCDWEALSNNVLNGTNWPDLLSISTMAVASKMWFLGLPLNEEYAFTSAVELPWASAD
jgi:hypothetical protein